MKVFKEWGWTVFWLVALMGLFHMSPADASEYSIKFGPGIEDNTTTGDTKIFGVRRAERMIYGLYNAVEAGGFVDNGGEGRKGAGLVKAQLGAQPGPEVGVYGKAFVGPCYLSTIDTQLGGHLQFCTDIGFGVRDSETFMGIGYSHISSAGLFTPNHGRDYYVFEVGVRL